MSKCRNTNATEVYNQLTVVQEHISDRQLK
jgi:hypothetical protein